MKVLEGFCAGVQERMSRAGFDWTTLLDALLPVLIEAIQNCFPSATELQAFVEGKRTGAQSIGLRLRCRSIVTKQGVRGILRVSKATDTLMDCVCDAMAEQAAKASGNAYSEAFEEAVNVAA